MKLTERQQAAVRYYEGDVSGTDPFWSDPKAYCTLNALLYPGLSTEKARAAEGKRLNSAFLEDPERLLSLCARLFEACEAMKTETAAETWRVERMADFAICRELGHTVSFTSTSRAGFLDAYADRRGIALMHFVIPAGTPCIDLAAALDRYAKEEEAELTLPPFVSLRFTETLEGVDFARLNTVLSQAFGGKERDAGITRETFENSPLVSFAFDGDKLVGCARAESDGVAQGLILNVAVDPEYQGLHIGQEVVDRLAARMKGQNLFLNTHPGGVGFYNRRGYRRNKTAMLCPAHPDMPAETARGFILPKGYRFADEMD